MEGFCIAYFLNPKLYTANCLLLTKTILDKINLYIHIVDTDCTSKGKRTTLPNHFKLWWTEVSQCVVWLVRAMPAQLELEASERQKNVVYFLTLDFSLSGYQVLLSNANAQYLHCKIVITQRRFYRFGRLAQRRQSSVCPCVQSEGICPKTWWP